MTPSSRANAVVGGVATVLVAGVGLWLGSVPHTSLALPWAPDGGESATSEPGVGATPTRPESAATVTPPPPKPLAGITIVLDPGHNSDNASNVAIINAQVPDGRGGFKACNTTGTMTPDGYPEYEFNWDVADRTRELLEEEGATVVLTREATGVGPCVDERGETAEAADADLMISIHGNGSESPEPHGFFVMIVGDPLNEAQGEPSRGLAEALSQALQEEGFVPSAWAGEIVTRNDLATLNHSTRPVVMLELAEFRNPVESQAVQDPAVRQRYAQGLADGAAAWVGDR